MDQDLLKSYLSTVYEFPTSEGIIRVSLDGELVQDTSKLPEILGKKFAIVTAYNPRSMLTPRSVNEKRLTLMRDLLIIGCYRIELCTGYELDPESTWREPSFLVYSMDREEAIAFGRVFRQNAIVFAQDGRPELIVTDPTADDVGRTFHGNWRVVKN